MLTQNYFIISLVGEKNRDKTQGEAGGKVPGERVSVL